VSETQNGRVGGGWIPDAPTRLWIGGEWRAAADGGTFDVIAPASEALLATVSAAGVGDVDAAVAAARAQLDGGAWSRLTGSDRRRLLIDIPGAIDTYHYFAGWADKIDGRSVQALPHLGHARHSYTIREPIGVVGAIVPWNSPTMITSWKLAPALAAGCTVVLKPPEDAPLATLALGLLIEEAGFPPGVINIVPGLGETAGAAIAAHPGVDKVSFTGSPEAGRSVALACARDFRRVTLELGGKSPQIILADADIEAAVTGTAMGLFANQGEVCAAGTRIFVAREHYDDVVAGLARAAADVRLGDPFDDSATMGALINRAQLDRVVGYVQAGRDEGARVVAGGGRPEGRGFFVEPTIFADGTNDMRIAREEIFGPVGVVMPFDDPDDAATLANDTPYGLAAFIWTQNLSAAHQLAARVRAGTVWVNGFGPPDARLPWGGLKTSGLGRELSYSGIEACTEEKVVTVVL
jgi:acyl-CoA reductase-like NAD-dependent aldehyde dehydrogenase